MKFIYMIIRDSVAQRKIPLSLDERREKFTMLAMDEQKERTRS